jgi:FlgD Ig-like domain
MVTAQGVEVMFEDHAGSTIGSVQLSIDAHADTIITAGWTPALGDSDSLVVRLTLISAQIDENEANNVVRVPASPGTVNVFDEPAANFTGLVALAPNPARTTVEVRFAQVRSGDVRLGIYDVAGRRVRILAQGHMPSGSHALRWDLTNDAGARARPGIYFVELLVDRQRSERRVVIVQ